jgi:hypothetical protein
MSAPDSRQITIPEFVKIASHKSLTAPNYPIVNPEASRQEIEGYRQQASEMNHVFQQAKDSLKRYQDDLQRIMDTHKGQIAWLNTIAREAQKKEKKFNKAKKTIIREKIANKVKNEFNKMLGQVKSLCAGILDNGEACTKPSAPKLRIGNNCYCNSCFFKHFSRFEFPDAKRARVDIDDQKKQEEEEEEKEDSLSELDVMSFD